MDTIELVLNSPHKAELFLVCVAAIVAVKFFIGLIDWFKERFGISTANSRREQEQSETIETLKTEVDQIKTDQSEVMECLNQLKTSVDKMQAKQDSADRARLKDRIGQAYRYYKERGEWNYMEKEAFDDLVSSYEQSGGENSFVHNICVPASLEWKIIE